MSKYLVMFLYWNMAYGGEFVYSARLITTIGKVFVLDKDTLVCTLENFQSRVQLYSLGQAAEGDTGALYDISAFYNPSLSFERISNIEFLFWVVGWTYRFCSVADGLYLWAKQLVPYERPPVGGLHVCFVCASVDGVYRLVFHIPGIDFLNVWIDAENGTALCYAWGMGISNGVSMFSAGDVYKFNVLSGYLAKLALMQGDVSLMQGRLY